MLFIDPNSVSTSYNFSSDPFDRLLKVTRAVGLTADETQTNYVYSTDLKTVDSYSDLNTSGDKAIRNSALYDGLGRSTENRQYISSTQYISVKKSYDALQRVSKISNPYQTDTETEYLTTTAYDGDDRVLSVTTGSDAAVSSFTYNGNQTTATDQAGKVRKTTNDGFGRISSVIEDPSVLAYPTSYSYDILDDLKGVTQGAKGRAFTYDSLKRLMTSSNPESGAICYGTKSGTTCTESYDGNGNLLNKTDGRSILTSFSYDALNRIGSKGYSDGVTPSVVYYYDKSGDGSGRPNAVGRLVATQAGTVFNQIYAYDSLGRVTHDELALGPNSAMYIPSSEYFDFFYKYKRSGALQQETYPSGRTIVVDGFDGAGRPTSAGPDGYSAVSGVLYASHGPVKQRTLGNGLSESITFNPGRLQETALTATLNGSTVLGLNYYYCSGQATSCTSNNGNVIGQNIAVPGAAFSQAFTYDGVNRLATATEGSTTWTQAYAYDQWGNHGVTGYRPNNDLTPKATSEYNSNNRWVRGAGDVYDGGGNQTGVGSYSAPSVSASTFGYDAENRLTSENSNGMGTVQYVYDGNGRRIEKLINGGGRVYVYDALGALSAEYTTQAIASGTSGGTSYFTVDAQGSTRLVTGALGSFTPVRKRYDYLPFGEEIASGVGARTAALGYGSATYPTTPDVVSEKFTGKERDAESGLDYFEARYMASPQGRFTSPDWNDEPDPVPYADFGNPQSLNLYSYVLNNPLKSTDPDGHTHQECGPDTSSVGDSGNLTITAGACNDVPDWWNVWTNYQNWRQQTVTDWNQRIDAHRPSNPSAKQLPSRR